MAQESSPSPLSQDEILQLLATDRLQTLSLISGEIFRHIQEPLQAIRGRAEALRAQLDHYQRDNAQGILDQLQNLELLLSFIENVVAPGSEQMQLLSPYDLMEDLSRFFQPRLNQEKIQIMNLLDSDLKLKVSVRDFKQIFTGIVLNAIEALERSSQLISPGKTILVQHQLVKNHHVFSVEDNGEGVDSADLQDLFLPFNSKKKGHIGFSLALCKKTALLQGWQLKAFRQHLGPGTRFEIWLPHSS